MKKFVLFVIIAGIVIAVINNNESKPLRRSISHYSHQSSSDGIQRQAPEVWQKYYEESEYYYNDYRNSPLLGGMFNKQAEFLVRMSIAAWNLDNKGTAQRHLKDAIEVLEENYGSYSADAARMLKNKMENGTCPREIPYDIVIGSTWDPIAKIPCCINYGVVTTVMLRADRAQLSSELEFLGRMTTLETIAEGQINTLRPQAQLEASQIRCSARLHYLDKTHEQFDPMRRPSDAGKQGIWDRTKAIYNIYND